MVWRPHDRTRVLFLLLRDADPSRIDTKSFLCYYQFPPQLVVDSHLQARVFAQDTRFMLACCGGPGLLPSPRVLSHGPDVGVELLQGPGELDRRGLARPREKARI